MDDPPALNSPLYDYAPSTTLRVLMLSLQPDANLTAIEQELVAVSDRPLEPFLRVKDY